MINTLNVRVYAAVVKNNAILVMNEFYAGEKLLKLPGGGLELGEGLHDCLHREFQEELNVKIKILSHLYTQDHFIASKFRENEQLLTVYFTAELVDEENLQIMDESIESVVWLPIEKETNPFKLPADKIAFEKLKELIFLP